MDKVDDVERWPCGCPKENGGRQFTLLCEMKVHDFADLVTVEPERGGPKSIGIRMLTGEQFYIELRMYMDCDDLIITDGVKPELTKDQDIAIKALINMNISGFTGVWDSGYGRELVTSTVNCEDEDNIAGHRQHVFRLLDTELLFEINSSLFPEDRRSYPYRLIVKPYPVEQYDKYCILRVDPDTLEYRVVKKNKFNFELELSDQQVDDLKDILSRLVKFVKAFNWKNK